MLGVVSHIGDDTAMIEYRKNGKDLVTNVSIPLSACMPRLGQQVYFFKNYKIVICVDESG